jgi:hypothetical protein
VLVQEDFEFDRQNHGKCSATDFPFFFLLRERAENEAKREEIFLHIFSVRIFLLVSFPALDTQYTYCCTTFFHFAFFSPFLNLIPHSPALLGLSLRPRWMNDDDSAGLNPASLTARHDTPEQSEMLLDSCRQSFSFHSFFSVRRTSTQSAHFLSPESHSSRALYSANTREQKFILLPPLCWLFSLLQASNTPRWSPQWTSVSAPDTLSLVPLSLEATKRSKK